MDAPLIQIGPYALNQPISDHPGTSKVSFFGRMFGIRKTLPGETPYKGGRIPLLDVNWVVNLGTYQNRIMRISADWGTTSEPEMEKKFCELVRWCEQRFEWNRPDCSRKDIQTWLTPTGVVKTNIQSMRINGRTSSYMISLEAIATAFAK